MLIFTKEWDTVRVLRTIHEECVGHIRKVSINDINKMRFYPVRDAALDACEMFVISEYIIERNKNGI